LYETQIDFLNVTVLNKIVFELEHKKFVRNSYILTEVIVKLKALEAQ